MATKTAFIRARTEPLLKQQAETIMDSLGLSPTSVINLLYKQIVKRRAIPFDVAEPNKTTRRAMTDARSGRAVRRHSSADALFVDLRKK
jgi:DNA-damage-inducible protein J